jgi:hypothetical protein
MDVLYNVYYTLGVQDMAKIEIINFLDIFSFHM